MKKIFYSLLVMCGLSLGACVNEVEDNFDQTAADRLNSHVVECQTLLTQPEHGWLIHYYPAKNRSYGGMVFAAKFDKQGYVTAAGDAAKKLNVDITTTATSHYSITTSSSVVLAFDTYNTIIHYWSDPDIHRNQYEADSEWAYVKGTEDRMEFMGIKTRNRIVFERLEQDIATTMKAIEPVYDYMHLENYYDGFNCKDQNGKVTVIKKTRGYSRFTCDEVGIPYTFIPGGIRFYEPAKIGDATVEYLKYDAAAKKLTSDKAVDAMGGSMEFSMEGFLHERYQPLEVFEGKYKFPYTMIWEGKKQVEVEVTIKKNPNKENSLIMSGLSWEPHVLYGWQDPGQYYDVDITFDPFDGTMGIYTQKVAETGATKQHWVYILPFCQYASIWWPYYASGITLKHNNDPDNMTLTFEFRDERGQINSLMLGRYLGPKEDNQWRYSITALGGLTNMTKIYE